ncbi:unnamed protein product [Clavelina lepadiformis]|uniref:Secreted protein n=1 Tax=Clavelina lepadiformis TaxID=159417 RepID=A0ABP0FJT3_CLALP
MIVEILVSTNIDFFLFFLLIFPGQCNSNTSSSSKAAVAIFATSRSPSTSLSRPNDVITGDRVRNLHLENTSPITSGQSLLRTATAGESTWFLHGVDISKR